MDKRPEYSKFVRVYMPYKEEDPYPLRFYAGVSPKDIDFMVAECVDDLRSHSNNDQLKLWNRPDGTELPNKNTVLNKLTSLVIAERQPRLASRPLHAVFANKHANLGIPTTANVSPMDSQDPIADVSSFSIAKEDLEKERSREKEREKEKEKEKERERERERLQESLSTKKLKGMVQPRKKSSGPIVEKVTPSSPTSTKKDTNKIRTRSVAKSFIINNKSPQQPATKPPANEMSFLPRSDSSKALVISHERIDTSLTFNPIRGAIGIDKGSYSMASVPKSRRDQYLSSQQHVLLNDSVSNQDELASKNEENSFAKFDKNSKKLLLQVQGDPTPRSNRRKASNLYQTGDVGTKPVDGKDPHVYSFEKCMAPFSYLIGTMENKFIDRLPPPLYFPSQTVLDRKPLKKSEILKDLEILPSGDLKLTDQEILKQQKGIIDEISKKLSKSVTDGRGIMGVSLPIKVFEARSLLERTCDWWTFVPNYIIPAAKSLNSIQRMKKVIGAAIGGLYVSAQQLKPFSPLLGETYQASFPQHGISISLESTSHAPNIANFILFHKDFKFWGKYEYITRLEGSSKNSMLIHHQGTNHVDFSDGQRISFTWPQIQITGLTTGDRTCKYVGSMQFVDEKAKIKTLIKFGDTGNDKSLPKKRNDIFSGKIYFYKDTESPNKKKSEKNDANYKDMKEEICTLHGSWLEYLQVEQEEVWNINKETPTQYVPVENPLPSDVRFREDILWLKRNNKLNAQEWKLILEERQRYERKLRMAQSLSQSQSKTKKK